MKAKKTFLINTAILTITALLLRGIGLVFRVYLSNVIGAEGMGLYQLILSVYMLASTFATCGISTAVTRLCADEIAIGNNKSVIKVLKRAVVLSAIIGAGLNLLVFVFSYPISTVFIGDARANASIKILSFSLVPMGVCASFKGYFFARRKTILPSIASIVEQVVRMVVVVVLLVVLKGKTIETVCFYVLLSDTIAETVSCLIMFFATVCDKRKLQTANKNGGISGSIVKAILKIALPITTGKYLTTGLRTAENLLVPKCLSWFSSSAKSGLETFGLLKGMAMPIIFFPSSFLQAISTLLIPEISQSVALNQKEVIRKDVERVISITITGSFLAGGCFYLCANQIGVAFYNSIETGALIKVLAPLVPIMYLESVIDGILKGLNKQNATLLYNTIDSSVRIFLVFLFVPKFGMLGFLAIMVFSNILTCSLNIAKLLSVIVLKFNIKNWLVKPLFSIVIAVVFSNQFLSGVTNNIAYIIISITLISTIYLLLMWNLKALDLAPFLRCKKSSKL